MPERRVTPALALCIVIHVARRADNDNQISNAANVVDHHLRWVTDGVSIDNRGHCQHAVRARGACKPQKDCEIRCTELIKNYLEAQSILDQATRRIMHNTMAMMTLAT